MYIYMAISRLISCYVFVPRPLRDICQALNSNGQDAIACHGMSWHAMPWHAMAWRGIDAMPWRCVALMPCRAMQ